MICLINTCIHFQLRSLYMYSFSCINLYDRNNHRSTCRYIGSSTLICLTLHYALACTCQFSFFSECCITLLVLYYDVLLMIYISFSLYYCFFECTICFSDSNYFVYVDIMHYAYIWLLLIYSLFDRCTVCTCFTWICYVPNSFDIMHYMQISVQLHQFIYMASNIRVSFTINSLFLRVYMWDIPKVLDEGWVFQNCLG